LLISVITPTYNRASFLTETIESISSQDYRNFEHIVIDDGSTDNTSEILARYPHLIVVKQANAGEAAAVNAGLARAKGDIIVIVNSDDPLRPNAFSAAVATFSANPEALLAYPDWEETDEGGNVTRVIHPEPGLTFERLLRTFNMPIGPAMFLRKRAIDRVGMRRLDRRFTGDLDLLMRIGAAGPLVHIPFVLGTHRVHGDAASSASQGSGMAKELVWLARDCLALPHGIPELTRDSRKIIALGHYAAHLHSGKDFRSHARHFFLFFVGSPAQSIKILANYVVILVGRAFHYVFQRNNLPLKDTIR
jgi:glycosyltransferase involved in cell wall biosynthesis